MPELSDPIAQAVLDRLHALDRVQMSSIIARYLPRWLWWRMVGQPKGPDMSYVRDQLAALDKEKAWFCHLLCRTVGARRIVEVGTSFGVSTIYLAAGLRETIRSSGGNGLVIGTEIEPAKAAAARANWSEARIEEFVELREGDYLET